MIKNNEDILLDSIELKTNIWELGLSNRTVDVLRDNDINRVSQLLMHDKEKIKSFNGIGKQSADKIFKIMNIFDIKLNKDPYLIENLTLTTRFEGILDFISRNEFEKLPLPELNNQEIIQFCAKHFPTVNDVLQITRFSAIKFTMSYKIPYHTSIMEIIKIKNIVAEQLSVPISTNQLPDSQEPNHLLFSDLETVNEINNAEAAQALSDAIDLEISNTLDEGTEEKHNNFYSDEIIDNQSEFTDDIFFFFLYVNSLYDVAFIEELTGVKSIINVTPRDLIKLDKNVLDSLKYSQFSNLIDIIEQNMLLIKPKEIITINGDDNNLVNAFKAYLRFFQYRRAFKSSDNMDNIIIKVKALIDYLTLSNVGFVRLERMKYIQNKKLSEGVQVNFQPDMEMIKKLEPFLNKYYQNNTPGNRISDNIIELIEQISWDNGIEFRVRTHLDVIVLFQLNDEFSILINTLQSLNGFTSFDLIEKYEIIMPKWCQIILTISKHKIIKTSELYKLYGINGVKYKTLFDLAIDLKIIKREKGYFLEI